MQEELRFATFNTFNLAPPGARLYDNLAPTTAAEYEAMLNLIEDAELNAIADARANSPEIAVSLDDL